MKVALVAPTPSNGAWGGAQRAVAGLQRAIAVERDAEVDLATLAVDESTLPGLIDACDRFHRLDVSAYDRVVSVK
ncbi:MAG: hypothetical protein JST73_06060, partial [Actinobacteria bacterium]|nr:hypothetical protein [Actinomycetota bacterium]